MLQSFHTIVTFSKLNPSLEPASNLRGTSFVNFTKPKKTSNVEGLQVSVIIELTNKTISRN